MSDMVNVRIFHIYVLDRCLNVNVRSLLLLSFLLDGCSTNPQVCMDSSAHQAQLGPEQAVAYNGSLLPSVAQATQVGQKRKAHEQLSRSNPGLALQDAHSEPHITQKATAQLVGKQLLASSVAEREAYEKDYKSLQTEHALLRLRSEALEKQNKAYEQQLANAQQQIRELEIENKAQANIMMCWSVFQKAFGKESWRKYFGEVDNEPLLPDDIDTVWNGPCPFWPNKKVDDTHMLVLIPAAVNGKPFTLNLLEELVRSPLNTLRSYETRFRLYNHKVQEEYGHNSPGRSYWILMTKDIIPDSAQKDYLAQQRLIADHARKHNLGYKLPGVLEATTAILTHYVRSGKRLYADDPVIYTRCSEQIDGPHPVAVGGFSDAGLHIHHTYHAISHGFGVSCLKKLT